MNDDMFCIAGGANGDEGNWMDCISPRPIECSECRYYKHKWPTPAQFRKEYEREVPDDIPIWVSKTIERVGVLMEYDLYLWSHYKETTQVDILIACTPYGRPSKNYRPKEEV